MNGVEHTREIYDDFHQQLLILYPAVKILFVRIYNAIISLNNFENYEHIVECLNEVDEMEIEDLDIIPLIDGILSEINDLLNEKTVNGIKYMNIFPEWNMEYNNFSNEYKSIVNQMVFLEDTGLL